MLCEARPHVRFHIGHVRPHVEVSRSSSGENASNRASSRLHVPKQEAQAVVECAAALVGAKFANGARVLLYQHEGGSYRNFGPLRAN